MYIVFKINFTKFIASNEIKSWENKTKKYITLFNPQERERIIISMYVKYYLFSLMKADIELFNLSKQLDLHFNK